LPESTEGDKDGKEGIMPAGFQLTILEGDKKEKIYPIEKLPVKIGRMSDNDIVLKDSLISRYHAVISMKDRAFFIEDLASKNGTFVNNVRISSRKLNAGDRITIGKNIILFDSAQKPVFSDDDELECTTIKPAKTILKDIADKAIDFSSSEVVEILKSRNEILNAIYQLSKSILRISVFEKILELTVDAILKNIPTVERVYILIKKTAAGPAVPVFHKAVDGISNPNDKLMISETIVNRVMNDEISLLVSDAKRDVRFRESESIILYGIRSAMCVPLLGEKSVRGALYVDVLKGKKQFSQSDLQLLTTIANLAAISLEEANLRDKIQRETEARQSLMRYHSPQVVEKIIKDKGDIKVNEMMITVLFIDIKDFTHRAESIGPLETVKLLNEYFDIITDIVFQYNGSIDKFIGDAAMAMFGAPYSSVDYTEKAVRAAIDIHRELKKLNKYDVRIGINTGPAVIGNIGSAKRMEYTSVGDTVNVASRLEKMAPPGKIYIGETTYEYIKDIFKTRPVIKQTVKGKTMEVNVYEVLV
jgi:adenylate cyclase